MWVWGEPILAPDRAVADFADRQRIAKLYVYVSPAAADALLSGRREAVEAAKAMAAKGRGLYAVAGEPEWTSGVAGLPTHAALLVRLTQTTRLFEGVHFDDDLTHSRMARSGRATAPCGGRAAIL